MTRIEVKSNEYKIVNSQDDLVLYTNDLNEEVACTFFSAKLEKACLGRNLTVEQLIQVFSEINPKNLQDLALISVHIVGGNEFKETEQYLEKLLEQLQIIDNNSNIINIKSFDAGSRIHPNSFEFDCYHGGIRKID
jgi:cobalamin biosynthesis Co2+ chelatase CbiK